MQNRVIAKQMGINRGVATKWRTRYANASKLLEQIEIDSPKKLTETVKEVLSDEYRSGKPLKFTPEQVACIIDLSPNSKHIFIMDQLNTHKSESLVRLIAEKCELDETDLGIKNKSGILKNMDTRAAFLTDKSHNVQIVYTPKHSSWLNQIECWFSIITRRFLNKRASFKSVQELEKGIQRFIEFYNEHMAKPFKWTYAGKLLHI